MVEFMVCDFYVMCDSPNSSAYNEMCVYVRAKMRKKMSKEREREECERRLFRPRSDMIVVW